MLIYMLICLQDVPEFTNLSAKAWDAAEGLQGLWGDAWDALDSASDSWGAQLTNLKQDWAEGKKDINIVVDEVRTAMQSHLCTCLVGFDINLQTALRGWYLW
jgi:hypothetical protein